MENMHPLNPTPAVRLLLKQYNNWKDLTDDQLEELQWFEKNIDELQKRVDLVLSTNSKTSIYSFFKLFDSYPPKPDPLSIKNTYRPIYSLIFGILGSIPIPYLGSGSQKFGFPTMRITL